ncbi:hypothetical protein ACQKWADRAFT_294544 [Trichoderma austrokoningii]
MPPADADDATLSIRFKYGIHTIFLFVDGLAPFSSVTEKLLEVLRERYPDGLTKSHSSPEVKTPIPDSPNVLYGLLRASAANPAQGWRALNIGEDASSTPTDCGLKDNSTVAFAFEDEAMESMGDDDGKTEFTVEWPQEEVDMS